MCYSFDAERKIYSPDSEKKRRRRRKGSRRRKKRRTMKGKQRGEDSEGYIYTKVLTLSMHFDYFYYYTYYFSTMPMFSTVEKALI